MFVQKFRPEDLTESYGALCQRLFPSPSIVAPPFGSTWAILNPGQTSTRHNHHEAEVFFLVEGHGVATISGEPRPVEAGDVIYAPPFSDHSLRNEDESAELRYLAVWWEDIGLARECTPTAAVEASNKVLVTATPPTVNGDLHLGHLAGPYIAADAFARHQRMRGREVYYVTGADDHQSYVARMAEKREEPPEETSDHFTDRIQRSLQAAGVGVDGFSRPRTSDSQRAFVQEFFLRLFEEGKIVLREGPSLFCSACDQHLFEAYVSGGCPHCGSKSDGNACEACGRPNDCVDLVNPVCNGCGGQPETRTLERFRFPLEPYADILRDHVATAPMSAHLRTLCQSMIAAGLPDLAVSHPTSWGVPVPIAGYGDQSIYVWFEMCPAYLAASEGAWTLADAEVIQFFGMDNGWFHGILFPALLKAFDPDLCLPSGYVTNEFYLLEGEKFSTSRRHAIWAGEFLEHEPVDHVRFYLALDRPETRQTSFSRPAYESAIQHELVQPWRVWLAALEEKVQREFGGRAPTTGGYEIRHRQFFMRVLRNVRDAERYYAAETFSLTALARLAGDLVRDANEFGIGEDHLAATPGLEGFRSSAVALELLAAKTLALITAPLLPTISARLWEALGYPERDCSWEPDPALVPAGQRIGELAKCVSPQTEALVESQSAPEAIRA